MTAYDFDRPYVPRERLRAYRATDAEVAARYGTTVKAIEMSNSEYRQRYGRMSGERRMKPPPSAGRTFPGYLVLRRLDFPDEYETWMPDHAFEAIYELLAGNKPDSQGA
jgi:hypothetical protein